MRTIRSRGYGKKTGTIKINIVNIYSEKEAEIILQKLDTAIRSAKRELKENEHSFEYEITLD